MATQRSIRQVVAAPLTPIGQMPMRQPLPMPGLPDLNPFLLLHHHGPHYFAPGSGGLPFGPHPHRGIQTVTFFLQGEGVHQDNLGNRFEVAEGGVQWMVTGSGLLHAEQLTERLLQSGGTAELMQLWVNLPARRKGEAPSYHGLQAADLPTLLLNQGRAQLTLVAGLYDGTPAAYPAQDGLHLYLLRLLPGADLTLHLPDGDVVLCYTVQGQAQVAGSALPAHSLADLHPTGTQLHLAAEAEALLLLGWAPPLNEPVVAHGPFVMNTEQEIRQAYDDFRHGRFGTWQGTL